MAKLFSAVRRGLKAAAQSFSPGPYRAQGRQIMCPHCGHGEFAEGSAQLNTAGMTFLNLDWANKSATTLACMNCGLIQWFVKPVERIAPE